MPNNLRTNPTGIDYWLQQVQIEMYKYLLMQWNIQDAQYQCFGRAYRNKAKDDAGYIPEAYLGNGEYQEVLIDDRFAATSFFYRGESIKVDESVFKATVYLVFFVNLPMLNTSTDRSDEQVETDVFKCTDDTFNLNLTCKYIGYEKTLSDFSGTRIKAAKFADIHPFHCFRMEYQMIYDNSNTYCNKPINQTA